MKERRYRVKEIFYTIQGEGSRAGWPAVFCRFAACNLWTGRERHRPSATCRFCDTDFVGTDGPGGATFATATGLALAIKRAWAGIEQNRARKYVVLTGGEPMLQVDRQLLAALHGLGFTIGVETNGTIDVPTTVDWICVSPKAGAPLRHTYGDDLKLVYPQNGVNPADYEHLDFARFLLQPMDGPNREASTAAAVAYCLQYPQWHLSLQTHKYIGVP